MKCRILVGAVRERALLLPTLGTTPRGCNSGIAFAGQAHGVFERPHVWMRCNGGLFEAGSDLVVEVAWGQLCTHGDALTAQRWRAMGAVVSASLDMLQPHDHHAWHCIVLHGSMERFLLALPHGAMLHSAAKHASEGS